MDNYLDVFLLPILYFGLPRYLLPFGVAELPTVFLARGYVDDVEHRLSHVRH